MNSRPTLYSFYNMIHSIICTLLLHPSWVKSCFYDLFSAVVSRTMYNQFTCISHTRVRIFAKATSGVTANQSIGHTFTRPIEVAILDCAIELNFIAAFCFSVLRPSSRNSCRMYTSATINCANASNAATTQLPKYNLRRAIPDYNVICQDRSLCFAFIMLYTCQSAAST